MLWIASSEYTAERHAVRLAELAGRARRSTVQMMLVAGCSVLALTVLDVGVIYAL